MLPRKRTFPLNACARPSIASCARANVTDGVLTPGQRWESQDTSEGEVRCGVQDLLLFQCNQDCSSCMPKLKMPLPMSMDIIKLTVSSCDSSKRHCMIQSYGWRARTTLNLQSEFESSKTELQHWPNIAWRMKMVVYIWVEMLRPLEGRKSLARLRQIGPKACSSIHVHLEQCHPKCSNALTARAYTATTYEKPRKPSIAANDHPSLLNPWLHESCLFWSLLYFLYGTAGSPAAIHYFTNLFILASHLS